jgi:hypothetical protein
VDIPRGHHHENPAPGCQIHRVQVAGGENGLKPDAGCIHRHAGVQAVVADPGDATLHKVGRPPLGSGEEKADVLQANGQPEAAVDRRIDLKLQVAFLQ